MRQRSGAVRVPRGRAGAGKLGGAQCARWRTPLGLWEKLGENLQGHLKGQEAETGWGGGMGPKAPW